MVTIAELDRAVAAGRAELTRVNTRAVRCTVQGCPVRIPPGHGRRLFLDGHPRGFVCARDARGVSARRQRAAGGVVTDRRPDRTRATLRGMAGKRPHVAADVPPPEPAA